MVSNSIFHLHQFAAEIGLGRHMYSNKKGKNRPHYDVPRALLEVALNKGAKLVLSSDIVTFLKEHYE